MDFDVLVVCIFYFIYKTNFTSFTVKIYKHLKIEMAVFVFLYAYTMLEIEMNLFIGSLFISGPVTHGKLISNT